MLQTSILKISPGKTVSTAKFFRAALLLISLFLVSISAAKADIIADWNAIGVTVIVTNAQRPPAASYIDLTYMHIAIYDAVNAIDGRYKPFAIKLDNVPSDASKEAAAAAAAYNILKNLFPSQQSFLDDAYARSLATIADGAGKAHGISVGEQVATRFLALRTGDGRNADVPYVAGSGPGVWQPTPPALAPTPLTPWVAKMKPFVMREPSQFRAEGPPDLASKRWAKDFNETKSLGSAASTTRTADQTELARFYTEHGGPQYGRLSRDIAAAQGLSLADSARFFAQVYVTCSDAWIAGWDSKYQFNFWRPVTAIRAADTDGNPATDVDSGWTPVATTPNHPEYPSAHGFLTASYIEAVRRFFGTKRLTFTVTSTVTGTSRTFHNTDDLIDEVIEARIWGGMHYRTSMLDGVEIGKSVAKWVAKHSFKPAN